MDAEDHDISQGDVAELDEHDGIYDEDDWMKDLPPPGTGQPREAEGDPLQEAEAERPPQDESLLSQHQKPAVSKVSTQ